MVFLTGLATTVKMQLDFGGYLDQNSSTVWNNMK